MPDKPKGYPPRPKPNPGWPGRDPKKPPIKTQPPKKK